MTGRRVMPSAVRIARPSLERDSRDEWRDLRRSGIGASDVAAILGLDPYKSSLDVYYDKMGYGEARRSAGMEEAARFGHLMQAVIAREFADRTGLWLLRSAQGMMAHADRPWMQCNLDCIVTEAGTPGRVPLELRWPVEVKTRSAYQAAEWRDQPADAPAIQLAWQLAVTGAEKGYIVALIGGNSLRWYEMQRDDELTTMLIDAAEEFRQRLADENPPDPDGLPRTSTLLDSVWLGDPGKFLLLDDDTAAGIQDDISIAQSLSAVIKAAQENHDAAENRIKVRMGDAEIALHGSRVLATWRRNGTFRSKDFTKDHPDLAARYQVQRQAIDTRKLAEDEPLLYNGYRSRAFRLATGTDGE